MLASNIKTEQDKQKFQIAFVSPFISSNKASTSIRGFEYKYFFMRSVGIGQLISFAELWDWLNAFWTVVGSSVELIVIVDSKKDIGKNIKISTSIFHEMC